MIFLTKVFLLKIANNCKKIIEIEKIKKKRKINKCDKRCHKNEEKKLPIYNSPIKNLINNSFSFFFIHGITCPYYIIICNLYTIITYVIVNNLSTIVPSTDNF